jgi:glucose-6-phosphate isomerase
MNCMPDRPKLLFAETIDARWLHAFRQGVVPHIKDPENILVTIISKSGGTTETIANAEIILHELEQLFDQQKMLERMVIIAGKGSDLWKYGEDHSIYCLSIPEKVGGRYSVFSNVGLFPLASVGIDVKLLLKGAREVLGWYLTGNAEDDAALNTALYIGKKYFTGRMIHDSFYFEPSLESLGKWQRQLIGESIGKSSLVGITPTVSIGSTDLHSVGQLYMAGPHHRMSEFVYVRGAPHERIPEHRIMPDLVPAIDHKDAHRIMSAIVTGTKRAYEVAERSFYEVTLDEIDAWHLGAYMQYKMLVVMYVAKLCDVNAFDQPAVELYKKETRAILESE